MSRIFQVPIQGKFIRMRKNTDSSQEKRKLGNNITNCLTELRSVKGWSVDDLSGYLELKYCTVRNSLSTGVWCDAAVTVLKLKYAIPEELAYEYKRAVEREAIEKRRKAAKKD